MPVLQNWHFASLQHLVQSDACPQAAGWCKWAHRHMVWHSVAVKVRMQAWAGQVQLAHELPIGQVQHRQPLLQMCHQRVGLATVLLLQASLCSTCAAPCPASCLQSAFS